MSTLLDPPRVLLWWVPTDFGADFGAYRVFRRPARAAAFDWVQVGEIDVPDGYDPATVEAHHNQWVDYAPGWAAPEGPYVDGWDYAVVAYNAATTLRSAIRDTALAGVVVPPARVTWMVCNAAPWLNAPLTTVQKLGGEDLDQVDVHQPVGRDFAVTRSRAELPARQWGISWRHLGFVGEDPARMSRAARASSRQLTVLTARGDRLEGSLITGQLGQTTDLALDADATLVETARHPALAGFNLPCGVDLDGTDYAVTVDDASLDPGTGPFSIVACAMVPAAAGVVLSKGNLTGANAYGLRRTVATELDETQSGSGTVDGRVTGSGHTLEGYGISPVGSLNDDPTRIPIVSSGYQVLPTSTGAGYAKAILDDLPVFVVGELRFGPGTPSVGSGVGVIVSPNDTPGLGVFDTVAESLHGSIAPEGLTLSLFEGLVPVEAATDTYTALTADTTYIGSITIAGRVATLKLTTSSNVEVGSVTIIDDRIPRLQGRAVIVENIKTNSGDMTPKIGHWQAITVSGVQFYVAGASINGGPTEATDAWDDLLPHVASASSDGTTQRLYVDGALAATGGLAHGSIANSVGLSVGAGNGGALNRLPLRPLHAWAYYPRVLSADEHQAAANYLLGRPGWRMPAGASVFFDLRDDRCWDGVHQVLTDLSDHALTATLTNTPATRGTPWPLADLDRWS